MLLPGSKILELMGLDQSKGRFPMALEQARILSLKTIDFDRIWNEAIRLSIR